MGSGRIITALAFLLLAQAASGALRKPWMSGSTNRAKWRRGLQTDWPLDNDEPTEPRYYPAHWIDVPIDHFHNDSLYEPHSNESFGMRYWLNSYHYKPSGPVLLLQGGETTGEYRMPILSKGLLDIVAKAIGGLAVVVEHRYYGKSIPVVDYSTENMRFLSTDQALADMAYFAQHVVYPGLEHLDLRAPQTPYIAFGPSYAGGLVAFLRKLYPDVFWGAVASSGVTEAVYDYWEYFEAARRFGPPSCINATQQLVRVVDGILIGNAGTDIGRRLKNAFGLGVLIDDPIFAETLAWMGIGSLQEEHWDPVRNSPVFAEYCGNVSSSTLLHPGLSPIKSEVRELIAISGYDGDVDALTNQMLNHIGHINQTFIHRCVDEGAKLEDCLSPFNPDYNPWTYQTCTEWGYFPSGAGVPQDQLPLISRLVDANNSFAVCQEMFNITKRPNLDAINKHGGLNISYPRLAFINGERDPWRAVTPHRIGMPPRESTLSEPFILIKGAVHHWETEGLLPSESKPGLPPCEVVAAQESIVAFVKGWMNQWEDEKALTRLLVQ